MSAMSINSLGSYPPIACHRQSLAKINTLNRSSFSRIGQKVRLFFENCYQSTYLSFSKKDAVRLDLATRRSAEHMANRVNYLFRKTRLMRGRPTEWDADLFRRTRYQLSHQKGENISYLRSLFERAEKLSVPFVIRNLSQFFTVIRELFVKKQRLELIQKFWVDSRIQQLENLKEGEECFWDGSWHPAHAGIKFGLGHKMEWVIRKQKDGRFQLDVVNTGDGLQFHYSAGPEKAYKRQAIYEIRDISKEHLINREFLGKVYGLSKISETDPSEYIYKTLLPSLQGKVAPMRDPDKEKQYWIKQQQGGSCSHRWMFPLVKSRLDQKQYDQWKLDTRMEDFTYLYGRIRRFPKETTTIHQTIALEILLKIERQCKKNGFALPSECQTAREKIQAMAEKKKPLENKPQTLSAIVEAIRQGYYQEAKEAIKKQDDKLFAQYRLNQSLPTLYIGTLYTLLFECEAIAKKQLTLQERIHLVDIVESIRGRLFLFLSDTEQQQLPGKNLLEKKIENHYDHYR